MGSYYFNDLKPITVFIHFDAQIVPDFIKRNTFKMAPESS